MSGNATCQSTRFALAFLMLAVALSCSGHGTTTDSDSVRNFVQDFYSWYVPTSAQGPADRPSDLVLKKRPAAFDSTLARELKEDADAQSKSPGDIVGLDFDPFLAAQDPCERYEVVAVRKEVESFRVSVRGSGGCENHEEPDVVAEVIAKDGGWLFANFHYPRSAGGDLLSILKKLRDDRKQDLK
jgi:hypothetical protein